MESLSTCPSAWKAQIHRFGEGLYWRPRMVLRLQGSQEGSPGVLASPLGIAVAVSLTTGHIAPSTCPMRHQSLLCSAPWTLSESSSQWAPWCLEEHEGPPDLPQLRLQAWPLSLLSLCASQQHKEFSSATMRVPWWCPHPSAHPTWVCEHHSPRVTSCPKCPANFLGASNGFPTSPAPCGLGLRVGTSLWTQL